MTVKMQARSSVSGALVTWETATPDWAGASFPGPGTALHVAVASAPISTGGATGDITDEVVTWSPTASPNGEAQSIHKTADTPNATPVDALTIALPDESFTGLTATVSGRSADDQHFEIDLRAAWSRTDGTVTERRAPATANPLATNPAGWAAVFVLSGTNAIVRVTGEAALAIRWSVLASAQIVTLDATPVAVYDPAVLSLTGWWRADFAASPWTPTASAGTSAANGNLAEATNPPAVGAAQNSLDPADFDGTNDLLANASAMSTLFTAGAGSIAVLFRADTAAAPGGGSYDNAALFGDTYPGLGLFFSSSGIIGGIYDTSATWKETAYVACATGAYHLAQMKWDGANLKIRIDSGAWTTVACADVAVLTGTVQISKNYNTAYLDGRILDIMTAASALSDGTFDSLVDYCNSRYDLAL